MTTSKGHRTGRRWRRTALVVGIVAAMALPVTALAGDGFTDVPNDNVFHDDIDWMADNGVTAGCNPPSNTRFCPKNTVTREQMAAFMRRLDTKKVFLRANAKATDADRLDGKDGVHFENPLAIRTGSVLDGTDAASDGEVARVTLTAPAAGVVVVRHTSSWDSGGYGVIMWAEPWVPGDECSSFLDGDPLPGTIGAADVPASGFHTIAGAGHDAVPAGARSYSLCRLTESGTPDSIDWSVSAEWRSSTTTSAALDAPRSGPADREILTGR